MSNVVGKKLEGVDVTVLIDQSGSMASPDRAGKSRWEAAEEGTIALAAKAAKFDPDGITVITFNNRPTKYEGVGVEKVAQIFKEKDPSGSTNLAGALDVAFTDFFARKSAGGSKPAGELFIVVTDGEPDSRSDVKDSITKAANKLDRDEELGILFVQIGNDPGAARFLKELDDDLKGAKFDIVNALSSDEVAERSLTEVLASAFED